MQMITEVQHENRGTIQSTLHAHVNDDRCLEVILVRGDGAKLKEIAEKLMALKGVESIKLTTISVN
jgi:CopG family nickel-responsive transcriptional regulator